MTEDFLTYIALVLLGLTVEQVSLMSPAERVEVLEIMRGKDSDNALQTRMRLNDGLR
jgi:hypothetical protein